MRYQTHMTGGLLIGVSSLNLVADKLNLNSDIASFEGMVFITGAVIGSLFPDIDHRGSYLGRKAKITSTITNALFGHRGITHSPIAMGAFVFFLYLLSKLFIVTSPFIKLWFIGFFLGILSHIFLDMLTKGGVPLLLPFTKKRISLTKMKTGSMGEKLVMIIMVIVCGYLSLKNIMLLNF